MMVSKQIGLNETIHLNQLENLDISSFRFVQTSNNYVEGDGFVVDNFQISRISFRLVWVILIQMQR